MLYLLAKPNKISLLQQRIQYPFIFLLLNYNDLIKKENDNLKYLFYSLVQEKTKRLMYINLFKEEKAFIDKGNYMFSSPE
jgi:hypothetical protein